MNFTTWTDSKLKRVSWADMLLVKLSCIVLGILLAALIPSLIAVNIWWLVAIVVILAVKPMYAIFKK